MEIDPGIKRRDSNPILNLLVTLRHTPKSVSSASSPKNETIYPFLRLCHRFRWGYMCKTE